MSKPGLGTFLPGTVLYGIGTVLSGTFKLIIQKNLEKRLNRKSVFLFLLDSVAIRTKPINRSPFCRVSAFFTQNPYFIGYWCVFARHELI